MPRHPLGVLTRKLFSSHPVLWLAVLGFAVRVAARLYTGEADFWVNAYPFFFSMARNIGANNGIGFEGVHPTAFRVPLYPIFLAAVTLGRHAFLPVVLSQALIGAGTVYCAALLAGEMFGTAAAAMAAGITAIYPYYVVHDTALQETSLFTLLTAISMLLLLRTQRNGSLLTAACAGLVLAADTLTRPTILPFAGFATAWLVCLGKGAWRARSRAGLICAAATLAAVSPWLVRSYQLTGVPVLSTETGVQLWSGNNPLTFSHYPLESSDLSKDAAYHALTAQDLADLERAGPGVALWDRWFMRRGLEYIRRHPWLTVGNGFRKVGAAFGWLPSPRHGVWVNLVHALSYGPVMVFGLLGMWMRRKHWREDAIVYGAFISFALITAVFWGHTSHRAYLDVYWIVFASGFLTELWRRYLAPQQPRLSASG